MSIKDFKNEVIEYTAENCNSFIDLRQKIKSLSNLLKKKT